MADKERDLKVSVLSNADRFDLAKPADELEQVADGAAHAGDELSQLSSAGDELRAVGQDAGRAGADVKGLGEDVERAADRVDAAFDKIAAASKRSTSKVDDAADKGSESLRDMGEEGSGTARELAASFDGSAASIQDGMQEAATNVLAALGPIGAGVGVAAGLGIGFLRGQAEKLKEEVSGIVGRLIEARGQVDRSGVLDQLRQLAEDGTITDLAAQARAANIDVSDYLRAMAGDPAALERTRDRLADINGLLVDNPLDMTSRDAVDFSRALYDVQTGLDDTATKYGLAAQASQEYADASGVSLEVTQAFTDAQSGFVDGIGAYQTVLANKEEAERTTAEATAAATKSQTDSWEDYVTDVTVSVDEYLDQLEAQVTAQEEWSTNLETLARRGVSEGVLAELARMGPEGAPLVAKLTTASDAELTRLVGLYRRKGQDASDELEGAIAAGRPGIAGEVAAIRQDMRDRLTPPIPMRATLSGPTPGQVSAVRRDVQNNMAPVEIPVMLRAVQPSTWSRLVP